MERVPGPPDIGFGRVRFVVTHEITKQGSRYPELNVAIDVRVKRI
jgi:hypothetical protein